METKTIRNLLQDNELSFEAKGMLFEWLSQSEDWEARKKHFIRKNTGGKTKIDRIFKELKEAGYIRLETIRDNENKRIIKKIWRLTIKKLEVEKC